MNTKWIDCQIELPSAHVAVIAYIPNECTFFQGLNIYIAELDSTGNFRMCDIEGETILPTHWMPIENLGVPA